MSLRRRLLLALGVSLCALWILVAGWLLLELHRQVRRTLDQRLESSAHMVAGLMSEVPPHVWRQAIGPVLSTPPSRGVLCQVSSMRGKVLLRTRGDLKGVFDNAHPGFSERTIDGHRWRLFTDIQGGLYITVADRLLERRRLQLGIVLAAALPFLVALIGSLIVGWWGIRRGLQPLDRLRFELARRDPETLTPVEIDDAPRELMPVITTLNRLLRRTDEAMRREQRFTSNAAHELRTPLTAIKTHVQLARRLDSKRAQDSLVQAESGVAHLQRTLEQLLMLARVESGQPWPDPTAARIEDIVRLAISDVGADVRIEMSGDVDDTRLGLPRELAVAALRNLLDNALRHSGAAQSVQLQIVGSERAVIFEVLDEGKSAHAPSVQRFSRGRDSTGSGLGLTIVQAIASRFGGELRFVRLRPHGLCAQLRLPSAPEYADAQTRPLAQR